jgi:hypothetical protein
MNEVKPAAAPHSRPAITDGFGLIAFASLFPMITVMGYAQIGAWWLRRETPQKSPSDE